MKNLVQYLIGVFVLSLSSTFCFAAGNWDFVIAPYLFVPSIDGDTSVGRLEGAEVDIGPVDIIKNLDLGVMIQLEAHHKSGFGVSLGYNFMDLSGGASHPSGSADLDVEIFQGVLEGYGTYRIETTNGPVDLYGGIRWWDMDVDVVLNNREVVSNSADWVDPVVGVRWMPQISEDWSLFVNGDIGGFGVSSDFTWNVQGGVAWRSTDYMSIVCLYRALSVDYSTGDVGTTDRFAYDTITHGPLFGLVFHL